MMSKKSPKAFKTEILSAAMMDSEKFFQLVSNTLNVSVLWSDVYHEKSGDTVVHIAAKYGYVDIIKYFYETKNESLLQQKNFDGKTPLHVAAQAGQVQCVKYLISCKVPVDPIKRADWTPLMLACTNDNVEIIKFLLSHGADLWIKNKDGWTPFHIAAREGHIDVIHCLLNADPDVWNTTSKNGRTPVHTAALHGHLETVEKILSYDDTCKNVQDSCGTTPLMDAASGNHKHIIDYLIRKKADIEKRDVLGRSVLHLAAQSGSLDCILYLVNDCSVDINQQTKDGLTPLHFAMKDYKKVFQLINLLLITLNSITSAFKQKSPSPKIDLEEDNSECINLLLKLGADSSVKDNRGRLAEEYCFKGVV